jgi:hypothetical protein
MKSPILFLAILFLCSSAEAASLHTISGKVTDFDGRPIAGATVEAKSTSFDALYSTRSDAEGRYSLKLEDGLYQSMTCIRMADYSKSNLEYWAWNVPVHADMTLNIRYDKLEVYGVNVFKVQGGPAGLFAYFRPMSLTRVKGKDPKKDPDIAPPDGEMELAVEVNGEAAKLDTLERVKEYAGPGPSMYGYLMHFTPAAPLKPGANAIRIVGHDKGTGDRGEGIYFYTAPDYRK